ncbi:MAG: HYR domain-containing protein, partial [Chitinophagales bacterium]|nr:HYR domain-containing protein [Chitinophagales bacterium]
ISSNAVVTSDYNGSQLSCATATDGTITVTASGGTGTLQYSSDNGTTWQSSNVFSNLGAGTYQIVVKDANNCMSTEQDVTITAPAAISVSDITHTDVSCFGGNNGSITLGTVSGGTPAYVYSWTTSDGIIPSGQEDDQNLTGLTPGTYHYSVTDANGCAAATGDVVVAYADHTPPAITCNTSSRVVNTDAGLCSYKAVGTEFDVTATDDCPLTYTYELSGGLNTTGSGSLAGVVFPKGTTHVKWTVSDGLQSSTCEFDVTVEDHENPTITCVANQTVNTDLGQCDYTVKGTEFDPAAFNDNCTGATISNDYNNSASLAGAEFPKGTTTVIWTVTDASNNTTTCSFTVTVQDKEKPKITCPANILVAAPQNACNTLVTITPPTVSDNCGVPSLLDPIRSDGQTVTDPFPVGVTTITWVVVDGSFNSNLCVQTVTVTGDITVTINCPATVTRNNDPGKCDALIDVDDLGNPGIVSGCNVVGFTRERSDGKTFSAPYPVGTTIITWKAVNGFGDVLKTCTQSVIVVDNEKPVITLPAVAASYDA